MATSFFSRSLRRTRFPGSSSLLNTTSQGSSLARLPACVRCFADYVVNVPSMGDSISEGTIVELPKAVGDGVAVDDVIAVIETDKVSVDIRAEEAGKITAIHAGADDTVLVGAPLLTLELGAAGAVSAKASTPEPASTPAPELAAAAPATPAAALAAMHARVPMIQFRHGVRAAAPMTPTAGMTRAPAPAIPAAVDLGLSYSAGTPARYLRKPISEEEMMIIQFGGAEPY